MKIIWQYIWKRRNHGKKSILELYRANLHDLITEILPIERCVQSYLKSYRYSAYIINKVIYIRSK